MITAAFVTRLRKHVANRLANGETLIELAKACGLSLYTFKRLVSRYRRDWPLHLRHAMVCHIAKVFGDPHLRSDAGYAPADVPPAFFSSVAAQAEPTLVKQLPALARLSSERQKALASILRSELAGSCKRSA